MVKKCSKCGIISLKSSFHKNKNMSDGVTPHCKLCRKIYRKNYYDEQYDVEINRRRKYRFDNEEKINLYEKNRREIDFNYKLAHNLRVRTR